MSGLILPHRHLIAPSQKPLAVTLLPKKVSNGTNTSSYNITDFDFGQERYTIVSVAWIDDSSATTTQNAFQYAEAVTDGIQSTVLWRFGGTLVDSQRTAFAYALLDGAKGVQTLNIKFNVTVLNVKLVAYDLTSFKGVVQTLNDSDSSGSSDKSSTVQTTGYEGDKNAIFGMVYRRSGNLAATDGMTTDQNASGDSSSYYSHHHAWPVPAGTKKLQASSFSASIRSNVSMMVIE